MEKGELGLAALPDRVQDFRMQLEMSIEYANCLQCKRFVNKAKPLESSISLCRDSDQVPHKRKNNNRIYISSGLCPNLFILKTISKHFNVIFKSVTWLPRCLECQGGIV